MLASVHVNATITAPLGAMAITVLLWYWMRLGRLDVPASRRRIRRVVTTLMMATVPLLVLGMSVHDPAVNQRGYVLTWTGVLVMVGVIVLGALVDVTNNLRIHQEHVRRDITDSLRRIAEAERRMQAGETPAGAENGLS